MNIYDLLIAKDVVGGGDTIANGLVEGTITSIELPNVSCIKQSMFYSSFYSITNFSFANCKSVGNYAFGYCKPIESLYMPELQEISANGFAYCGLTSACFSKLVSASAYVFGYCTSLSEVDLPNLETISPSLFYWCTALEKANIPKAQTLGRQAFWNCKLLEELNLPMVVSVGSNCFGNCQEIKTMSLGSGLTSSASLTGFVGSDAFYRCYNLLSLYLLAPNVYPLASSNYFSSTPIGGYTESTSGVYGSIYVPASLYSNYITAENWSAYSERFVSISK